MALRPIDIFFSVLPFDNKRIEVTNEDTPCFHLTISSTRQQLKTGNNWGEKENYALFRFRRNPMSPLI